MRPNNALTPSGQERPNQALQRTRLRRAAERPNR